MKGEINYKRTECDSVYTFLSAVPHWWTCSDFTGMCIPDLVLVFCSLHSFFVYQQKPLHVPVEADNKAIYIQFFCFFLFMFQFASPCWPSVKVKVCGCIVCLAQVTHSGRSLQVIPNLTLKDSAGHSVLGVALWAGNQLEIAEQLLGGGANVNDTDTEGRTLLLQAISRHDVDSALFLLQNQADANARQVCLLSFIYHPFALSVYIGIVRYHLAAVRYWFLLAVEICDSVCKIVNL